MADSPEYLVLVDIGVRNSFTNYKQKLKGFIFCFMSFHANFQGDDGEGGFCPTVVLHAKFQGSAETRTEIFRARRSRDLLSIKGQIVDPRWRLANLFLLLLFGETTSAFRGILPFLFYLLFII